jgi:hypothetical protein
LQGDVGREAPRAGGPGDARRVREHGELHPPQVAKGVFVCSGGGERERDARVKFGYPRVVEECGSGVVWECVVIPRQKCINLVQHRCARPLQSLGGSSAPDMRT